MTNPITNVAGYQFRTVADVETMHAQVQALCARTHLKGTVFISPEGINLSLAGSPTDIEYVLGQLDEVCGFDRLQVNTTCSDSIPFRRLLVKIREELVPMTLPATDTIRHAQAEARYITSDELRQWICTGRVMTLLDLRNRFEYELGTFMHAQNLGLRHFRELGSAAPKLAKLPRTAPVVTFCTGGIRCEKGASYIASLGFKHVYKLKGGILDYLKKFQEEDWRGDCFVFDERISLNHRLEPTYARLCRVCQVVLNEDEEQVCRSCSPSAAINPA